MRFRHMVAQVLILQPLQSLMFLHCDARPLLVYDVGEDGILPAFLHIVRFPVIRQLVPCLLTEHALLDPFLRAAMLTPKSAGAVQGYLWIGHFLDAFIADFCQPELDRLRLGTRHGLHKAQEGFCVGNISQVFLAILGG